MTTSPRSARSSSRPLNVPVFLALGAGFWLLAALMIRVLGPAVFVPGSASLVLVFAVSLPIAWAFVWLGATLGGASGAAVLPAVIVMTSVAMLLDGLAMIFVPALYGVPRDVLLFGAAWLLWGVGLCQTIAFVRARRAG